MEHRCTFSHAEAATIRSILAEKPRTKTTRSKLRNLGFYISDFSTHPPFEIQDFDRLVRNGVIKIDESDRSAIPETNLASRQPSFRISADLAIDGPEGYRNAYRPQYVKYLVVGESPPQGGRFFYQANSILFRQTQIAFSHVFGKACGDGVAFLQFFQEQGFYLDDLCLVPVNGLPDQDRIRKRLAGIGPLAERIKSYKPTKIIVVMKGIASEVGVACRVAGVNPPDLVLPFPVRPAHQATFRGDLARFLQAHV